MAYQTPKVGTVLPAQKNTNVQNPGPVHDPRGTDEWLQAQAQNTAWENNLDLVEEYNNAPRAARGLAGSNSEELRRCRQ